MTPEARPEVEADSAEVAVDLEDEKQKREVESDPTFQNRSLQRPRHIQWHIILNSITKTEATQNFEDLKLRAQHVQHGQACRLAV